MFVYILPRVLNHSMSHVAPYGARQLACSQCRVNHVPNPLHKPIGQRCKELLSGFLTDEHRRNLFDLSSRCFHIALQQCRRQCCCSLQQLPEGVTTENLKGFPATDMHGHRPQQHHVCLIDAHFVEEACHLVDGSMDALCHDFVE